MDEPMLLVIPTASAISSRAAAPQIPSDWLGFILRSIGWLPYHLKTSDLAHGLHPEVSYGCEATPHISLTLPHLVLVANPHFSPPFIAKHLRGSVQTADADDTKRQYLNTKIPISSSTT